MLNEKKKVVSRVGFPDFLASDEEKNTQEYGLSMAKAIESEWFYRSSGKTCNFYDRRSNYHNLRLYARGEQDTKIYKDLLNNGEGESYTNYDWRPLQLVPKFVKLVVNQMTERLFEIKAEATDKFSTDLKEAYKTNLENLMMSAPIMKLAKDELGVDIFPPDMEEIPESQEEIDVSMKLKYKPAIEIASEEAIKYTLDLNDYDEIQSSLIEDITVIGIGALKHNTDPSKGIVIDYIDPANLIYSYPKTRDFKDVFYYGEVKRVTINELKRLSSGQLSEEQLKEIADARANWINYHGESNESGGDSSSALENTMVDIMFFNFKSTNTLNYKKKYLKNGGYNMTRKESTFGVPEGEEGFDSIKKVIDVWYEGVLVLGTDIIFNYKLCENMVRPEGYLNITSPNYIVYAPEIYQGRTKSLIDRIVPYVDQMQQIHIKLQQLIAKARPNGIYIDVDGLNEIDMGNGNFLTPLEVIKIYDETGNIIGTSTTAEGDYNYGREPIKELKNGIVDGLDRLINAYNHYLNLLRDAIGIPVGADATMPHPDTLVGVQQQVALNSNTATRHILDSSLNISKRLGRGLSLRLKDIFKYSDLKNVYINAIGKINVHVLEALKRYHLHDLGINIELKPDAQEKQFLEANIQGALAQQSITLDDAIDIRAISNVKLANEVLKIRRVKREKEKRAHEENIARIQSQAQVEAAERMAQVKQMEIQAKTQADLTTINAKSEAELRKLEFEKQSKLELMGKEFEYNMILRGMDTEAMMEKERLKENRKDERIDRQSSHTSKIAEQKATNAPAINFESNFDHMNGDMGLGTHEPS